jgi:hypothetical protein
LPKSDRITVLQVEAETIVKRLKVTNESGERRLLLAELRELLNRLDAVNDKPHASK